MADVKHPKKFYDEDPDFPPISSPPSEEAEKADQPRNLRGKFTLDPGESFLPGMVSGIPGIKGKVGHVVTDLAGDVDGVDPEDDSGNVTQGDEEEGEEVEKSDFDESKVERDENGRFSSGGGGDDISVEVSEIPDAEDMFGVPTDSEDGEWKENRITFQEADDQYNGFLNSGADAIKEAIGNAKLEPIFPDNLVSNQTSVDSGKLIAIAANPKSEPIVVVRTNTGDYVYDGNHRASVASILGDHVEAKVVDVSSS